MTLPRIEKKTKSKNIQSKKEIIPRRLFITFSHKVYYQNEISKLHALFRKSLRGYFIVLIYHITPLFCSLPFLATIFFSFIHNTFTFPVLCINKNVSLCMKLNTFEEKTEKNKNIQVKHHKRLVSGILIYLRKTTYRLI